MSFPTYTDAWLASFHRDPPADPDEDEWDDDDESRATAERLTGSDVVAGPGGRLAEGQAVP